MDSLAELIAKFDRERPEDMRIAREELKRRPLTSENFSCVDITEVLLCHEITRLRAELAEYKQDAERYRWLREKIENDDFVVARVSDWGFTSWSGDDPDRYIDEALAARGDG